MNQCDDGESKPVESGLSAGLLGTTKFSGCGAKLGPGVLEKALCGLSQPAYPGLVADFSGFEDAGLFDLGDGRDLVQTVDFFPPIVNDPRLFGRIAAANALSDIWAMGGKPLTALAILCFPVKTLGPDSLRAMMEGGLEALVEAGCALLGGHSVEDPEPKLGYAVTGLVAHGRAWRNALKDADCSLILTKPLGTGLVNMAVRAGLASAEARDAAERGMAALNGPAARILSGFEVRACTDVTGFGFLGHLAEMVAEGPVGVDVRADAVPLLPGAREYAGLGLVPEGTWRNREGRAKFIHDPGATDEVTMDILFDPQTSGGLLAALPRARADEALEALRRAGIPAAIVGTGTDAHGGIDLVP